MDYILRLPKRLSLTSRILNETLRRREPVLRVLFAATFTVLFLSLLALYIAYSSGFDRQVLSRLTAVLVALFTVGALRVLLQLRHYFVAGYGLLGIYWLLATVMAVEWGVNLPVVLLLYSTVIVLGGIVLGAWYSLFAALSSVGIVFIIQLATVQGHLHPNLMWRQSPIHLSDLLVYYFVFVLLGICSWLFNRQTDRSLHHALRAEAALQREKAMLETKVAARTEQLEKVQAEKIQQLHRFAELGQFTASLLHDLANHITTLSVDIEGMAEQHYRSQLQLRIQRRIAYIDAMMQWAHDHINGKNQDKHFNATHEIQEAVKMLQYRARVARVHVDLPKPMPKLPLYGDPTRFRQLMTNLICNAIDAYGKATDDAGRNVQIEGEQNNDGSVRITVRDHGSGIPKDIQEKVFDPFYTTKDDGMGIGLFVAKQIVEEYFGGTIRLVSHKGETSFTITLRKAHE